MEQIEGDGRADMHRRMRELEGQVKSAKAEVVKARVQINELKAQFRKKVEHLRFLIQNRLHAKPGDNDTLQPSQQSASLPVSSSLSDSHQDSDDDDTTHPSSAASAKIDEAHAATMLRQADWREAIKPVGYIRSCFRKKNGTPRQASLVPDSAATLKITAFPNPEQSLDGLEGFSHVWIVFFFHLNDNVAIKPKIRPPRLNGRKVGVFSTRSPHRPNPIGLSLVRLNKIVDDTLFLSGVDLVDGTPVLDVKPYLPRFDRPEDGGHIPEWLESAPRGSLRVEFEPQAIQQLHEHVHKLKYIESADAFIEAARRIFEEDPRSTYRKDKCSDEPYGLTLDGLDVQARFGDDDVVYIHTIKPFQPRKERVLGHLSA